MVERPDVPDTAENSIVLPAEPASAARAREFVRSLLRRSRHRDLEDAAVLCVTELVANVARHTESPDCVVTLLDQPDELFIEVSDQAWEAPELQGVSDRNEHGRGLVIVDALAGAWGVRRHDGDGKGVWLRLCPA